MGKLQYREKNDYQRWIAEYKKRRDALRKEHNIPKAGKNSAPPDIIARLYNLTCKIKRWNRCLHKIARKEAILIHAADCLRKYFDVDVHYSLPSKDKQLTLIRSIFVKYCMERGVQGIYVSRFVNAKSVEWASRVRLRFTRSFPNNAHNRHTYFKLKQFIDEHC